ncbi:PREDICTED: aspartic proteinase CDR1-like [Ipomoea nil]|uniref:aspartic proteinase CDR1-like n=1 Tax=Ipomoea nil TaxID=35883 RepID=UPI000901B8D1|nr:PREDICTED: aspartic proteinase CDR1-like [Ipomoea nil]
MSYKSMDLTVIFMLSVFALISTKIINGFTIELIHPNSPSNPYRNPSNNKFDPIRQAYSNTRPRAASIQSRLRVNVDASFKFKTDVKPLDGGYVMKYSIGTPPFETYGVADTGSDVTWTQCEPCIHCFPQSLPIFDPKHSKSYKTATCDSDACYLDDFHYCSDDNVCQYDVSYGDESQSAGDVVTDTLTIGDASFKNVVLGCGHRNDVTFSNGIASGIVGLGYSNVSIVKHLSEEIGGKFAHCLSSQSDSKSYISFGPDAIVTGPDSVSTHISIRPEEPPFYWLSLESMSVGDKNFPVKQSPPETPGNIIIDSGMTMTTLPPDVFDSMKSEMMKQIPGKTPIDDPQGLFGLCYSTSKKIKVPKIIAHFSGAHVELSPRGLFEEVEEGISCFTITSFTYMETSIFGCPSQVDYHIGYNLEEMMVTFKPADCSKF